MNSLVLKRDIREGYSCSLFRYSCNLKMSLLLNIYKKHESTTPKN